MFSFSGFILSCKMRLLKVLKHKILLLLSVVVISASFVWGPTVYQESWIDPFTTLDVPNRELHPHAMNMIGMINSEDPFHPLYYTNEGKILELMHGLQRSTPLSSEEQASLLLDNQKVTYFTLHRGPSIYHVEEDFALKYYSEKGVVWFGQQFFWINETSIYLLTQISKEMTFGWWK
ncbi:MAG TPA: hypothetical protein VFC84_00400 [Desulfosporosinus sp.]|nr:hypothetical protein [Desulfosporosinus sp.]